MKQTRAVRYGALWLALSAAYALPFTALDALWWAQSDYWMGGRWVRWIEFFVVEALFTAPIAALSGVLIAATRPFVRRDRYALQMPLAAHASAVVVLIAMLGAGVRPPIFAIATLHTAWVALTAALLLLKITERASLAYVTGLWIACHLSMYAVLAATGRMLFLEVDPGAIASAFALVWGFGSFGFLILVTAIAVPRARVVRRVIVAAVLLAGAPGAVWMSPTLHAAPRDPMPPNVLLITADALRADYCSVYGGPVATPALESLAARGASFTRAYSLAPWTVPSFSGMFTSKYPPSLTPGAPPEQNTKEEHSYHLLIPYWLEAGEHTFLDRLRALHGMRTLAFSGNPAIAMYMSWILRDFDRYQSVFTFDADPERGFFRRHPTLYAIVRELRPEWIDRRPFDNTWRLTRRVDEALRRSRNQPFFIWVHLLDPHSPYDPPREYRRGSTRWPFFPPFDGEGSDALAQGLDEASRADVRALYEGEIRYVDQAVGNILHALEAAGLDQSTYVCFTSDHGEELFDHGKLGHGHALHEEHLRVPLIFAGPRIVPQRIDAPVSLIDVLPTLAGLVGLEASREWRGENLAHVLRGRATFEPRPVYAQATDFFWYRPSPKQAVIDGDLKLIRDLATGELTLFDLKSDPCEQTNLAESRPEETRRLDALLDAWQATFPSTISQMVQLDASAHHPVTAENRETLRSLGYVD